MTPETDHLENGLGTAAGMIHPTFWAFARKLERERNEARELLREIRDDEVNAQDECDKFLRDHVPSELSKVTEQRDRLADRCCCVSPCSISSFLLEGLRHKDPAVRVMKWLAVFNAIMVVAFLIYKLTA